MSAEGVLGHLIEHKECGKLKISLGMIVRNEGETLDRTLTSIAPYVDQIVIGLAGESTDNTEEIARKYTDIVVPIKWTDNFSEARNAVMALCTGDYYMWLDGDDEVLGGENIRAHLEANPSVGLFHMNYDYGQDEYGNTMTQLIRERIAKRAYGYYWTGRIHETLTAPELHASHLVRDVVVKHLPSTKVRGDRNYELLQKDLAEAEPNPSPRLLFYLGQEAIGHSDFTGAITYFERYLSQSRWNEEAYQVQHRIADIYRMQGDLGHALSADMKAIKIAPDWPDAWYGMAETAYLMNDWKSCIEWTKAASTKAIPETYLITHPLDYEFNPRIILGNAYLNLGDPVSARDNYVLAYGVRKDPAVLEMIRSTNREIERQEVTQGFFKTIEYLCRNDEWLKARRIFAYAPKLLEQHPDFMQLYELVQANTAHVENPELMEEHYINNPSWEPMPDDSIEDENWLTYPRLAFAISVARSVAAQAIVDLGCSDGFMSLPLAKLGYSVHGVDLDPRCVAIATERAKKWEVDASFSQGNLNSVGEWADCADFYKYDLAILFETLEHVVSPTETLATVERVAHHVAITTPYLAWEDGNVPEWSKRELKGHLRIFDLADMEILLGSRGRIHNLYREPWGTTGWIFADYEVTSERHQKSVDIICPPVLEPWGPRTLKEKGLGGSETAVIQLARELSDPSTRVTVYNECDSLGYFDTVRYRHIGNFHPSVRSNLSIAWRYPEAADDRPNCDTFVLWMHDTDAADRLTPERAKEFDFIVVLSQWHKRYFLRKYPFVDHNKIKVIGNGVDKNRFIAEVDRNPKKVIYSSSPDRGLDVILEHIWPEVIRQVPDAELHYYYGWNNIDVSAPNYPHLKAFKEKVERLQSLTANVFDHGRLPQDRLAEEMLSGNIWLYPTYFNETYCITAVEAQVAGLYPIYNPIGALETDVVASGEAIPLHELKKYVQAVVRIIKNPPNEQRIDIMRRAPVKGWDEIATSWRNAFLS